MLCLIDRKLPRQRALRLPSGWGRTPTPAHFAAHFHTGLPRSQETARHEYAWHTPHASLECQKVTIRFERGSWSAFHIDVVAGCLTVGVLFAQIRNKSPGWTVTSVKLPNRVASPQFENNYSQKCAAVPRRARI